MRTPQPSLENKTHNKGIKRYEKYVYVIDCMSEEGFAWWVERKSGEQSEA